jgi:hypothetical protein
MPHHAVDFSPETEYPKRDGVRRLPSKSLSYVGGKTFVARPAVALFVRVSDREPCDGQKSRFANASNTSCML